MKVVLVPPRYGEQVFGGAEQALRMFAEHLAAAGDVVTVLTTCAADLRTWANDLPEGTTVEQGVEVHRFPTSTRRTADFDAWGARLLASPARTSIAEGREWVRRQGPHSPALLDAIAAASGDVAVFSPYLYEPTVEGIARTHAIPVLHPAAHDEQPLRLPVFDDVFGAARGLLFHTESEQRLVHRRFGVAATPQIVLGLGSDPRPGDPDAARAALGLGDDPYLLCLGRIDEGKGTSLLARFFAAWRDLHPSAARVRLVLAGSVVDPPPAHRDLVVAGPVDETSKWGLLRGATALVSPSAFESFSIVLVEAWHAGTPVLVNACCHATSEHCARSGGGLAFDGFASFCVGVERLVRDEELRARLSAAGGAYVDANFTWPEIIRRYRAFLARLAD